MIDNSLTHFLLLQFADFRFNNEAIRKVRKPLESTNCHQFVPYSSFASHELPRFMDITNNEKRVYLKHQFNLEKENKLRHEGTEDLYTSYDSKKYLDLGVAPLQRIINDLRSISSHSTEDLCDHRAAKASGLVGYGEYLQGAKHPSRK